MKTLLSLLSILSLPALAQQTIVQQPDCIIFLHFTATGQTSPTAPNAGFSNLTTGCTTWTLSYANTGFSALSLVFQSAPNVGGVAGTWVTFAGGTITAGVNPNTNTTGAFTWVVGYNPWLRVTLASSTGTGQIDGALFGYRVPNAGASPAASQDVNLAKVGGAAVALGQTTMSASLPVALASDQSSLPVTPVANSAVNISQIGGATATGCPNTAVVSVTGGNTTQIVALSGSTNIKVCSIAISMSLAGSAQFISGTGVNCAGGPANLTGAIPLATGVPLTLAAPIGNTLLSAGASNALCIAAVTGNVLGFIGYQQN